MITGIDNTTVTSVIDVDVPIVGVNIAIPFNFVTENSGALQLGGTPSLNTAVITESSESGGEVAQITQYWS